ncbi:hypothetical protein AKJ39_02065 [candidate division MSBL1 archaeon SCGC-AAA259J03]|uniref:Acyl-CoA synthetase n=1 Tax=candidate division MSBL1 archaeon SCGC-AAA259J03 TaxID=1698269 RepID=A0A656YWH0_9EURY|nr:hypothetical protein AKJ39_02065 [candidate division MSBL1 archaeon SCGC-AAA259J03]
MPQRVNVTEKAIIEKPDEFDEREALTWRNGALTYQELREKVTGYANWFKEKGVKKGDFVLSRLNTQPEAYISYLALMYIGAVPAPVSVLVAPGEFQYFVDDCQPRVVLFDENNSDAIDETKTGKIELEIPIESIELDQSISKEVISPAATSREDPAYMLYSSGTTGEPKGILHGHKDWIGFSDPYKHVSTGKGDRVLHPHELSFSYTWAVGFMTPLMDGATIVVFQDRVRPEKLSSTIKECKATVFCTVPTVYRMILQADINSNIIAHNIQMCTSAGGHLSEKLMKKWKQRFGLPIYNIFGTSEDMIQTICIEEEKVGSLGKPLPHLRMNVVDEDGNPKKPGETGHLVVGQDNPVHFIEYLNKPEEWEKSHREGWFYPGDHAYKDKDGFFWYVSRSDDIIVSREYLISPKEVEDALISHPEIEEAGVIGVPDKVFGERVVAFITTESKELNTPVNEIRDWLKGEIAKYKVPKEIRLISSLPKSDTGKLQRRKLNEIYNSQKED